MNEPAITPQLIGQALMERRYADAARMLATWVGQHPYDADAWFNLGFCQRQMLQPDDALRSYQKALDTGISEPAQVYLNIAAIKAEVMLDVEGARNSLEAALSLQPGFVLAWQNLGQLEEDVGNVDAARSAYESALQHAPGLGRAHARLAAMDVFTGHPAQGLARVEQAAALARTNDDLVELTFAAANALDAMHRHDEAFGHALDANQLQQRSSPLIHRRSDVAAQIDAMISLFPAEPLTAAATTVSPIFICGLFRSGSTLLETLLARHAGISMGGELAYTPWFLAEYGAGITHETVAQAAHTFREGYTRFVKSVLGETSVFTDKRMDNFLYLGLIKRAFPAAKIVHVMRDPIDNFLSMYFQPFADNLTYANDFEDMLDYYRQYRRMMAHWQVCFGEDIIPVRYETLVTQPEPVMSDLVTKLGLTVSETLVSDQIIRTASVWQVRQPIHARSRGRWRNYEAHIGELAALLRLEYPEFSE